MPRILFVALFLVLLAAAATAQSTSPSIFSYDTSRGGSKAKAASAGVADGLFGKILRAFLCVDMLDRQNAEALLNLERMRDLLGAEPNPDVLTQLAGAIGARYVINVDAAQLPNGSIYIQIMVVDSTTGKAVIRRDAGPLTDQNIDDGIKSLEAQAFADMGNLLKGKCDEHWTGSISYRYRFNETKPFRNEGVASVADYAGAKTAGESETRAMDDTFVLLRPMSLGSTNPYSPGVTVTRQFEYHHTEKWETTMQVRCRPRGANSYLRPTKESRYEKMDESGEAKAERTVYIDLRPTGEFVITMNKPVEIPSKWTREDTEQRPGGCEDPAPVTSTSKGENSVFAAGYKRAEGEIRGRYDLKDQDTLKGKIIDGKAELGILTIEWDLKRVRPKPRTK